MKKRILTALILVPVVLTSCIVPAPYPLFCLCLLVATLSFWELRTLAGVPKALPVVTLFGIGVPFFGTELQTNRSPLQVILYASVFWLAGIIFAYRCSKGKSNASEVDMAGLWIAMPLTCLLMLHRLRFPDLPQTAHFTNVEALLQNQFILLALLPLWAGDIVALFVGKALGKHLMAPKISPNKTWEGSVANLVACVLVAGLLCLVLGDPSRLPVHIECGVAIGIFGQVGDLFESYLKRRANLKDSGNLLPGHGGLLDRIDSFLFTAPIVSLILLVNFR